MSETARRQARRCLVAVATTSSPPEMVDVVFDLAARALPAGFEWPLYLAISALAPWIADSPHAGVHPLRGTRLADGGLLVARRAKLVVRMPRDRVCAASVLEGATLDLGAATVRVGQGTFRKLRSASTLYSPRVAMGAEEEDAFCRRVGAALESLDVRRPFLCGRRVEVAFDGRTHMAFSLAVHGLDEAQSLLLQRAGLGAGRPVGCGLFVPHKTITVLG
jgi:CRISPR-associated protein Cas6